MREGFSMTGLASVLKGVQPDLRDTIKRLHREGWTPSKTSGGHIRLDHVRAAKPVFTASTPSDFRTPFNVLRDCRAALMSGAQCSEPASPPICADQAADILSAHKRKLRRGAQVRFADLPGLVAGKIRSGDAKKTNITPLMETGNSAATPVKTETPDPLHGPQKGLTETPAHDEKKDLTDMNMIAHSQIDTASPVAPMSEPTGTGAPHKEQMSGSSVPMPVAAPDPGRKGSSGQTQATGIIALDQDAVRIGMMIALGELISLEITPEMVGQTLVFAQAPYLIGARIGAGQVRQPVTQRRNHAYNDTIIEFLRSFAGDDVPLSMIAEHMISKGHYKPRSARMGVKLRLEQLLEAGSITLSEGPGEPHARLKE
jgi:predicted RNA binding protein YcfA (HicA-like mRNA interferase family)